LEVDLLEDHLVASAHVYTGFFNNDGTATEPLVDFTLDSLSGGSWVPIPGTTITGNSNHALVVPFGQLYAGWDGVTSIANQKACHLHNRGTYRRVHHPAVTDPVDLIATVTPETQIPGTQWFLVPGSTENTVRIASTRDGRRLRFFTGTTVGTAAATNVQPQTEWRVVPDQHGWYFIEHPGTNQRLRVNGSGTLVMGPVTSTADDFKWRFAVPAVPEPVSAPPAPLNPTATAQATAIAISWDAAPGAAAYAVQRSNAAEGPWSAVASGITSTQWTDSGLPADATRFYQIIATHPLGDSAPSAVVAATTLHPNATYETWVGIQLADFPPEDRLPDADPDRDGLANRLEFAFLTHPDRPDGNPFRIGRGVSGDLTLHFPWNWRAQGHEWRLRHGHDLSKLASWILR
jgi:hypothetical protein